MKLFNRIVTNITGEEKREEEVEEVATPVVDAKGKVEKQNVLDNIPQMDFSGPSSKDKEGLSWSGRVNSESVTSNEKEKLVKQYIDTLVNGTPIAQLGIEKLTDKAQEALKELQASLLNDNYKEAQEQLGKIKAEIEGLKPLLEELTAQRDALKCEITELEGNKEAVILAVDGEIADYRETRKAEIDSELASNIAEMDKELENKRATVDADIAEIVGEFAAKREEYDSFLEDLTKEIEEARSSTEEQKAHLVQEVEERKEELNRENNELAEELEAKRKELDEVTEKYNELQKLVTELSDKFNEISTSIENLLSDTEVEWETITAKNGIYAVEGYLLNSYINDLIETYASKMGVSIDEARNEFRAKSPSLFAIIKRLENDDERFNTLYSIANGSTSIENALKSVKLPVYKTRGSKANLSDVSIKNIKLLQKISYFENLALDEKARRERAEKNYNDLMETLVPLIREDVDLEAVLAELSNKQR